MRLLLLEDDPDLLRTLLEGLRIAFPTFEIEAVRSAEDAEAALDRGYCAFCPSPSSSPSSPKRSKRPT